MVHSFEPDTPYVQGFPQKRVPCIYYKFSDTEQSLTFRQL